MRGRPIPNAPERSVDASNVREYIPGDSLRLVHWKTTARQAKPYVRLFDGTPASDWWILLDLQAEEQVGSEGDLTEEHGVILAASLADRGLRAHRGVGLIINGKRLEWLPPRSGFGQLWECSAHTGACLARQDTAQGVRTRPTKPGRNASLVIITATRQTDWFIRLPLLAVRGITPTIFLLDLHSFDASLDNSGVAAELKKMHVACHMLPREIFERPEAHPGTQGQWEWHISALGKAIPVRAPQNHRWRRLAK